MNVAMIAAVSENGVIGKDGYIPWHLPSDLARFREMTEGNTVIMGRKTFQSLSGPLKNRTNFILSRNPTFVESINGQARADLRAFRSLREAVNAATTDVFIIGGMEIYDLAIIFADTIHITKVYINVDGDTYFPNFNLRSWICQVEAPEYDSKTNIRYQYITYYRHGE